MKHLGADLPGTERYNNLNSEFEMMAESSMKPFANNSNKKQNESIMDRTDINTTPSSADKL